MKLVQLVPAEGSTRLGTNTVTAPGKEVTQLHAMASVQGVDHSLRSPGDLVRFLGISRLSGAYVALVVHVFELLSEGLSLAVRPDRSFENIASCYVNIIYA